jgi:flagellin
LGIEVIKGEGVKTIETAEQSIGLLSDAIKKLSTQRADIGAILNVLSPNMNPLQVSKEAQIRSESVLRDADLAYEMMNLTKNLILQDFTNTMFAQANLNPRLVLNIIT